MERRQLVQVARNSDAFFEEIAELELVELRLPHMNTIFLGTQFNFHHPYKRMFLTLHCYLVLFPLSFPLKLSRCVLLRRWVHAVAK